MKKNILLLTLSLFILLREGITNSLFAEVKGIFTVNTTVDINNYPVAPIVYNSTTNNYYWDRSPNLFRNIDNGWWMKSQDYWLLAYEKASFLDLGFEINTDNFNLVTRFDFMQDPFANMTKRSEIYTNVPFLGAMVDLTFPRVGFIDYTSNDEKFYLSLGRRTIKWGPGFYDIQIADSQPYLDNIWASYTTPLTPQSKWNFDYNYVFGKA